MVSALGVSGSPWPQLHSEYVTSSQQPGLACSPSNFGVGFSRASGLRLEARTDFSGFQGGTQANSSLLGFRVKVLGLFPGAAPLPLLAGALHTLPGPGLSDDPRPPFHSGH